MKEGPEFGELLRKGNSDRASGKDPETKTDLPKARIEDSPSNTCPPEAFSLAKDIPEGPPGKSELQESFKSLFVGNPAPTF
ncbi:MAG: hypothetical protein DRN81_05735 [Thermoproteota archaeon]|nr:MAG: hypothetical protein DRN81_05735 [Candidatus Korarchaeota archaeon]